MYTVFILRKARYSQEVLDRYNIYFSNFFRQYVTFDSNLQYWYPKAVLNVVDFGDLTFDPAYSKALQKAPKSHGRAHGWPHG